MDEIVHIFPLMSVLCFTCCCAFNYKLIPEAKTWSEAQSFCRKECTGLVTVHDMTEMDDLLERFQGQNVDGLWIGLTKGTDQEWQWSLADGHFYKEGERNYFNWGESLSTTNCIYFRNELLYKDHCTRKKQAICFDESKQGLERYVLTAGQFYWQDARDSCKANYTDLASVRNAAESAAVHEVAGGASVWIGLFRDRWVWSDSSDSSFRFFPIGTQPFTNTDPKCIAIPNGGSGRWVERDCNQTLPFICQCPRSSMTLKVTLGSASGLDMHDPAVQRSIVQQLEQMLNERQSTGRVSLRWVTKSDGTVFEVKRPVKEKKEDCPHF